ncbi:hypothetical protein ACSBR2_017097 [Camellia fascicularis]
MIGMIVETYGFIVLFSGFWPTLAVFLQRLPLVGWVFQQPFVTSFFERSRGRRVPREFQGKRVARVANGRGEDVVLIWKWWWLVG